MEAIEELCQLLESMQQASTLLADEDVDETSSSIGSSSRRTSTFLNCVALGNVVSCFIFLFLLLFSRMQRYMYVQVGWRFCARRDFSFLIFFKFRNLLKKEEEEPKRCRFGSINGVGAFFVVKVGCLLRYDYCTGLGCLQRYQAQIF